MGVDIPDAELDEMIAVTEGWTAAVHLAGLWMRARGDATGLLRGLVETDRSLGDFLMNEVIDLQPPDVVEFLTATAELETFDATLADAVLGRHDGVDMLARVRAANLFLVEGHRAGWYRYHHLFAEFLRSRLRTAAPGRAAVIHRAAADAFTARGELIDAVEHSMRADDTEVALTRLSAYAYANFSLDDQPVGGTTARAWLDRHGASQLERSPPRVLMCTILLSAAGRRDDAERWLRLVDGQQADLDRDDRVLLQTAWSIHHIQAGDPAAALARVELARAELGGDHRHSVWGRALPDVAVQAQLWLDDLDAAAASLDAVRTGPVQPPVTSDVRVPGFASQVEAQRGELTNAERLATFALDAADGLGLHPANAGRAEPHLTLAMVATERDRLDDADAHLDELLRIVERGRRPPLEVLAHLQRALVAGARGRVDDATEAIDRARAVLPEAGALVTARIDQTALRLALDRGDRATAEVVQRRLPPSPTSDLLAVRVSLAADDHRRAREVLGAMSHPSAARRVRVEHGVLDALTVAGSDPARARDVLARTLALAEPAGFHRTFVAEGPPLWRLLESLPAHDRIADYCADLLDAAHRTVPAPGGSTRSVARQAPVDPLSDRELTVLRYLSSRLTCTEIARELYLSVNTVRSHVKAIYRKLGVKSRSQAVARGRALSLR
jgi:LuxR family maltose regulon positive regulatory protein